MYRRDSGGNTGVGRKGRGGGTRGCGQPSATEGEGTWVAYARSFDRIARRRKRLSGGEAHGANGICAMMRGGERMGFPASFAEIVSPKRRV